MHAGTPSARQSQAQYTAHPCTLLGPGLSSDWRQAVVLQLCPSSSPTICPLKELWFRFICLQWRSICLWNTFYSFKAPEIKFSCPPRPCSHNCITLNQQKCLATRHHPSAQMFPSKHGHLCSDQWGWTRGAEPMLCFSQSQGQHLCNTIFFPFPFSLPTEVFPGLELHPVPQAWKKKGLICCSSCRLQYMCILGHPWRQNDICMLDAIEWEHNALKPLRKPTGQLIWFKPIFKFYETHFQG